MSLKLYDYEASANCYKVRLLLAQLSLRYERIPIDIFAGDTLTPEFRQKNPSRSTPVLEIGDGTYLTESNAILFYLAEDTPFLPAGRLDRADVVRWLIVEQQEVMTMVGGLRFRLVTGRWKPDDPDAIRRRRGAEGALALLDEHLSTRDFLVSGRYTIADIANYAYSHVAGEAGLDLGRYPAIERWHRRVEGTPLFMNDLVPYPANSRAGAGTSIYS